MSRACRGLVPSLVIIGAIFCLGMAAIAAALAYTQQPDAQGRPSGLTIRLNTDLVVIDVTATDKSGNYIRDLRPEEVQVFEDGQERKINFFTMTDEAALSRPLAVVFALGEYPPLAWIKRAAAVAFIIIGVLILIGKF